MKIKLHFILAIFVVVAVFVYFYSAGKEKLTSNLIKPGNTLTANEREKNEREGEEAEREDGILLAQQQEFELTKDRSLGYIPKYRLINAYEDLMKQRREGKINRTTALTWTERGPNADVAGPYGNSRPVTAATSGRIRAIWVDIADGTNKTVWVGGIDGGIWKTSDITANPSAWTLVNDFFGNLAIGSICQDPSNTNIMYFGTGEKTFNGDAVHGGGIWKSTNHGVTWSLLASTTGFWNVSKILCDASGNVYVATIGNNAGIQRSINGGTTWINITPSGLTSYVTEMKLSTTGRMHIVCGYVGASPSGYRFSDNPSTVTPVSWISPAVSFTPVAYNVELGVVGNTLYALPANSEYKTPQVWKSTDGGANWFATPTSPPSASGTFDLNLGQGWYDLALGVDPANPNNIIVGGFNCWRSTNGGNTWSQASSWFGTDGQYIHADQHTVIWNGNQVLIGSDGGLFYSADGGFTFTDRNTGLRLKQFYSVAIHPTSTNYMLGGTQDNGTHQLNNPGLGGSVEVTGGDGGFTHIDQDEPQYQFGAYIYNDYRRSTDGGASWVSAHFSTTIGQFINPFDYDDMSNKLYASGMADYYVRWENPQTGDNFTAVPLSAFNHEGSVHVKVSPHTPNRVYFGTGIGSIIRVDNAQLDAPAAVNITAAFSGTFAAVSCVAIGTTDNNLLATFSTYGAPHVFVSTVGGGSAGWTNITGNLPDIPVRWALFYPEDNTRAIIATEMGVYETTNINGASTIWTQDPSFQVVRTDMLKYRSADGLVAAATHGRGIWTASIPFVTPYVRFAYRYNSKTETTTGTSGCRGYTDYTVNMKIDLPPTGNANVTLSLAGGATATQGIDYDFTTNGNFVAPSSTLTFLNGSSTPQPITIRVYNDDAVESDESFTLNYSIGGGTNAQAAPGSLSYTFIIKDNDVPPLSNFKVGSHNMDAADVTPFRSNKQKHRVQALFTAAELLGSGMPGATSLTSITLKVVTKNSTHPYNGFTISMANTNLSDLSGFVNTGFTQVYTGNYSTVAGDNTFTFNVPFAWNGSSNVIVQFCFDNGSQAVDANADLTEGNDYSLNGAFATNYSDYAGEATSGCSLQHMWFTGARINAKFGASVSPETSAVIKTTYLGPNNDVYAYNTNGRIIARVRNLSSHNYGCTQIEIDRAGTGATAFWNNNNGNKLLNKTFRVVPTTNNALGQYEVTLYYSKAEVDAWVAATGQSWNTIQLVKVAGQVSQITPGQPNAAGPITIVSPVRGTFGSDYTLTYTFTTGFSGFGAGVIGYPLPVTLLEFKGELQHQNVMLEWSTTFEYNSKNFEIEKSYDGVTFRKLATVQAAGNSTILRHYNYLDAEPAAEVNFYRLKMIDADGNSRLSQVIMIKNPYVIQNLYVLNNPFRNYIDIRFSKIPQGKVILQLMDITGKQLAMAEYSQAATVYRVNTPGELPAKGVYILRAQVEGMVYTRKVVKQ